MLILFSVSDDGSLWVTMQNPFLTKYSPSLISIYLVTFLLFSSSSSYNYESDSIWLLYEFAWFKSDPLDSGVSGSSSSESSDVF